MRSLLVVSLLVTAASADDKGKAGKPIPPKPVEAKPLEMLEEAKVLMTVGACAKTEVKVKSPDLVAEHCKKVTQAQDDYKKN